jgi:hypothetical protein
MISFERPVATGPGRAWMRYGVEHVADARADDRCISFCLGESCASLSLVVPKRDLRECEPSGWGFRLGRQCMVTDTKNAREGSDREFHFAKHHELRGELDAVGHVVPGPIPLAYSRQAVPTRWHRPVQREPAPGESSVDGSGAGVTTVIMAGDTI